MFFFSNTCGKNSNQIYYYYNHDIIITKTLEFTEDKVSSGNSECSLNLQVDVWVCY